MEKENNINDYRIKLKNTVKNCGKNKRVNHKHTISKQDIEKAYIAVMPFIKNALLAENEYSLFCGEMDLKNYEKWLANGDNK